MKGYRPVPPFDKWPRQWTNKDCGHCWVTVDPPALVTQTTATVSTELGVRYVQDFLDECLAFGFLTRYPDTVIVHDWRTLASQEPKAKTAWAARARRAGNPFGDCTSYVALAPSSLMRMSFQVGSLALQIKVKAPSVQLIDDVEALVRSRGIVSPQHGLLERLRAGK